MNCGTYQCADICADICRCLYIPIYLYVDSNLGNSTCSPVWRKGHLITLIDVGNIVNLINLMNKVPHSLVCELKSVLDISMSKNSLIYFMQIEDCN